MHTMDVRPEDIQELLEFFSKNTYNAWDTHPKVQNVMQRCLDLFALDYTYSVVSNSNGELSTNYPSSLVVLVGDKHSGENDETTASNGGLPFSLSTSVLASASTNSNGQTDTNSVASNSTSMTASSIDGFNPAHELPKIKDLCSKARYARCRARFPVPVILYNNKHICRSATLSGGPEIYGRASFDYFFSGSSTTETKPDEPEIAEPEVVVPDTEGQGQGDWQLFDRVRNQDIRLLKAFQVQTIVDLMVEKKKVKFGVYVTSSEKVDKKDRYRDFTLISLPYPGCEFFKQYRDNGYNAEELMFEWNQGHVDANIFVPPDVSTDALNLEWSQYRKWDLVCLTQNYLKLLLAYLKGNHRGMLIHCISGWDRTPLFVSLLRLSLWADGAIHQSLNAKQILYLTLAYDWLLFGHNLEDRLNKGEEILFFCFYFLSHIVDREYSVAPEDELSTDDEKNSEVSTSQAPGDIPADGALNGCSEVLPNGNGHAEDLEESPQTVVHSAPESNGCEAPCRPSVNGDHVEVANCVELEGANGVGLEGAKGVGLEGANGVGLEGANGVDLEGVNGAQDSSSVDRLADGLSRSNIDSNDCKFGLPDDPTVTSQSVQSQPNLNETLPLQNGITKVVARTDEGSSDNGTVPKVPDNEPAEDPCPTNSSESPLKVTSNGDVNGLPCEVNGSVKGNGVDTLNPPNGCDPENAVSQSDPLSVAAELPELSDSASPAATADVGTGTNGNSEVVIEQLQLDPSIKKTRRCERLHLVRAHFYALYGSAIGFQPRNNVSDSNSGSGLSVIIDNIATKVGIRAANRSTS